MSNLPGPKILVTMHAIVTVNGNQQEKVYPVGPDGVIAEVEFAGVPMCIYVNQKDEYIEFAPLTALGDPRKMKQFGTIRPSGLIS